MDPVHKKVLARKTFVIVERVSNPVVLSGYLSTLFNASDKEEIEAKYNRMGATIATQTFLSLLEKRGKKAFHLFIEVLKNPEIKQEDLAMELENEERRLRGQAEFPMRRTASLPLLSGEPDDAPMSYFPRNISEPLEALKPKRVQVISFSQEPQSPIVKHPPRAGSSNQTHHELHSPSVVITPDSLVKDIPFSLRLKIEWMMNPESANNHDWRGLACAMEMSADEVRQLQGNTKGKMAGLFDRMIHTKKTVSDLLVLLKHDEVQRLDVIDKIKDKLSERIPAYVEARGSKAIAAYQKAKATGKTLDRRVKVLLIGQDRVGKTSVGRSLKGEQFRADEASTDGVQMYEPLKNPGTQPWKTSVMQKETTAYHHKCAEYIGKALLSESTAGQSAQEGQDEKTRSGTETEPSASSEPHSVSDETKITEILRDARGQVGESIPDQIAHLLEREISKEEAAVADGIWPVIWDFAGQAVYRAIHPIFLSPEAAYILVFDLTKDLLAASQCRLKKEGHQEVEIPVADTNDTNLDHIMRWMDLVHSLRDPENGTVSRNVVLVGTHADLVDGDPEKKMDAMKNFLTGYAKVFIKRIARTVTVDNTHSGQEDPQIVKLREEILKIADNMPYTKIEVPLKWLEVENKIYDLSKQGEKYTTRRKFMSQIVAHKDDDVADDLEHLLDFLHDRGTVVYHNCADNPGGLVVLDPQWLIDILCKILTVKGDKEEALHILSLRRALKEEGILDAELLDHACKNLELGHIKESLLFIMKKFNLLCDWKHDINKATYLVPCMLTVKPQEDLMGPVFQGCAPVYITFDTSYAPFGLFTRLIVVFGEWVAAITSTGKPDLFANAARFVIGEVTCVAFACSKTVIKVHIWTMDGSNPVEREPKVTLEAARMLKNSLEKLREQCHWLRAVSWTLCGQCKMCPGKVDPETAECFWHQERKCLHDDCAHYVPTDNSPFFCKDTKGPDLRVPKTWIQALCGDTKFQEDSGVKDAPSARNRAVKEGIPTDDELEELSQCIAEAWKPLGRRLKIEEAKLTGFHKENEEYSEKAFKMLLHWKERDASAATYGVLLDALCHKLVKQKLLAEEFCCD